MGLFITIDSLQAATGIAASSSPIAALHCLSPSHSVTFLWRSYPLNNDALQFVPFPRRVIGTQGANWVTGLK